ncbi:hypothetical protein IR215_02025 [Simulacricoccus sp. 17bor-14]|nr:MULTISPECIES: peptidase MA family metallohydrolase [Myxococcaceae]MBF5041154.1 hypothetical protein [Simulacricoccus sp. 17bor-14]
MPPALLLLLALLGAPRALAATPQPSPVEDVRGERALPSVVASDGRTSAGSHAGGEPALLPLPRPALVAGELSTRRFRILYTARAEGAARALAKEIEGVRDSFGQLLGRDWKGTTEIRVGVGREEFEALALPGGAPPGWAVALAYPAHQIILLDALSLRSEQGPTTLRHELAHVALGQLGPAWPRWFQEGLAMNVSGERLSVSQYTALFRAVRQDRILHFEDLDEGWPEQPWDVEVAYAQSSAFVAHLASRYGPERMAELVDAVGRGAPFETAFARAFRSTLRLEEESWREELPARYGWLPLATTGELLWLLATLLCCAAFVLRQRQKRRHLAALELEDAREAEEEARLAAEEAALAAPSTLALPPLTDSALPSWEPPAPAASEAPPEAAPPEAERDAEAQRPTKPTLH